jgi:hypothetical protein
MAAAAAWVNQEHGTFVISNACNSHQTTLAMLRTCLNVSLLNSAIQQPCSCGAVKRICFSAAATADLSQSE